MEGSSVHRPRPLYPPPLRQPTLPQLATTYAGSGTHRIVALRCRGIIVAASAGADGDRLGRWLQDGTGARFQQEAPLAARLSPRLYLRGLRCRDHLRSGCNTWGITVSGAQLAAADPEVRERFFPTASLDGFTPVHLFRTDLVTQALTLYATVHGIEPGATLTVDPTALVYLLHQLDAHATLLRRLLADIPHVDVAYEDLAGRSGPSRAAEVLSTGLGLAGAARRPFASVERRRRLEEVSNRAELAAALSHTRFGS